METTMAICPKCKSEMFIEGTKMRCGNPGCPYQYEVPVKISMGQIIAEHKRFYDKLYAIKGIIAGEDTPSKKLAEIELILEDD